MQQNLRLRVQAQQAFLKSQAHELVTRATNSKTRRAQIFLPGDLVYFKRIKPPAQPQAHVRLAHKLWRWYGPARVLASETRTDARGQERKPSNVIWIVSHGRLKRCSPEQLRHASAREQAIAEGMSAPTAAWTFHNLAQTLYKGEYEILDDFLLPEDVVSKGAPKTPRRSKSLGREAPSTPGTAIRSASVPRTPVKRTPEEVQEHQKIPTRAQKGEMASGGGTHQEAESSRPGKERKMTKMPKEEEGPSLGSSSSVPTSGVRSPVDLGRLIRDPSYDPPAMATVRRTSELFEQPLFKKQRQQLAEVTSDDLLAHSFFNTAGELNTSSMACSIDLDLPTRDSDCVV